MRYLSVCSGIEAASVAWHPLGWKPVAFAEIEAFPSAVLAHHYPGVPNWGDMTKFQEWPDACACVQVWTERSSGRGVRHDRSRSNASSAKQRVNSGASGGDIHGSSTCAKCGGTVIDLLVGGTPCQSFSVAGLRKGLADPRGNLALTYLALADKYRPEWLVWENVPGVLSADGGEAFGAFLGGLGELGYGWAYRVLDAQYFGLAQRRKRVFVVASLGGWQRAAAVLFDAASLRGDSAPRREARQSVADTFGARTTAGGGFGGDFETTGGLVPEIVGTLSDGAHMGGGLTGRTPTPAASLPSVSLCLNAGGMGRIDAERETLIPTGGFFDHLPIGLDEEQNAVIDGFGCLKARTDGGGFEGVVAHSLRADGFDVSEDGTGRGTPIVAFSVKDYGADAGDLAPTLRAGGHDKSHANGGVMPAIAFDTTQITSKANYSQPKAGDPCHPLAAGAHPPAIAFDARQSDVIQYGEKSGPLDTDGHSMGVLSVRTANTSANGHGIAEDVTHTLDRAQGQAVMTAMQVRRLTPVECARLQGFPDTYLDITYRGKPAADGNKYKALGNSMAVPVMRWIGERIALVEEIP